MGEKRSSGDGFAQGDLFGAAGGDGVGGRQRRARPATGGGGYLGNCGVSNFRLPDAEPPDPRFDELAAIGIGGPWLRLARRVGFDVFLEIWRAISEDEGTRHDGGRRMPKLREFSAYQRYQRNLYIRSLAATGLDPKAVRALVEKNLRQRLSIKAIQTIMRGHGDHAICERFEGHDDEAGGG